jgi:hypothetical protein
MLDLLNRGELDKVTAKELDALIPRIVRAALSRITFTTPSDNIDWTDVPFKSGLFVQTTGTWTVAQTDVVAFKYLVHGKLLHLHFSCVTTTLNGVTVLRLQLPAGFFARDDGATVGTFAWDNGTIARVGVVKVGAGGAFLTLTRSDTNVGDAFANAVDLYGISFAVAIQLQ